MRKLLKYRFSLLILMFLLLNKFEGIRQTEMQFPSQDFHSYILSLTNYSEVCLPYMNNKWKGDMRGFVMPSYKAELAVASCCILILSFVPLVIHFDKRRKITTMLIFHFEGSKYKDSFSFS